MSDRTELDIEKMMTNIEDITKSLRLYDAYRSVDTDGLSKIWDQFDLFMDNDHSDGSYADSKFELWLEGFLIGFLHSGIATAQRFID